MTVRKLCSILRQRFLRDSGNRLQKRIASVARWGRVDGEHTGAQQWYERLESRELLSIAAPTPITMSPVTPTAAAYVMLNSEVTNPGAAEAIRLAVHPPATLVTSELQIAELGYVELERVSVSAEGVPANHNSRAPSISADGRYVAFQSSASNLVPDDTNNVDDIFVHDRQTDQIERVSLSTDGVQGIASSEAPSISADGRYVAFRSFASNLVPNDTNSDADIFVYDRQTDEIERVSVAAGGGQSNAHSYDPAISGDGRYVTFWSGATNLVPGDTNNANDVFVYDRQTDTIERVSLAAGGVQGDGNSSVPSISADGRYVSFESFADNLVPDDTNNRIDIFVYDRQTDLVERVSLAAGGVQVTSSSQASSISGDGRYVSFWSNASTLVPNDTNGQPDIFVYDRQTDQIERVSVSAAGVQGNARSYDPSISGDGRYVSFESYASNLVPDDTNGQPDIFVYDRQTGEIVRANVSAGGEQANHISEAASLSADGRFVSFQSFASNLVPGGTNGEIGIFVVELDATSPEASVFGNGLVIVDDDSTPSHTDHTDFGSITQGGATISRTFNVSNTGTATLTTSGLTVPAGYTVTEGLSGSIAAGFSDTFTVQLDSATVGTKSGQISFVTNDGDENPYNFSIIGVVEAAPTPEVDLQGNGQSIADGDASPSNGDHTDFGTVTQGDAPVSRTFTVSNTGTATLTTSGLIVPAGFTITEGLSGSIEAGGSDTFTVQLDSATLEIKSGQISFTNNDSDENPYNFSITGTVTAVTAPEVEVQGNGLVIVDGDASPSSSDHTDFGSITQGGATISRTFNVSNTGTATLTTSDLSVPAGYTVIEGLSGSIPAGGSDTFTVQLDSATQGTKSGQISFITNDGDESPYNFSISGMVVEAAEPEVEVRGNGVVIVDGAASPNGGAHNDFGSTTQGGATVSRTFDVSNIGTATLTTSDLVVPAGYTITEGLSGSILPGGSDSFTVRLDSATLGVKSGEISFVTNDSDENPYNFAISGEVTEAFDPEVDVQGNGVVIVDGDGTPSSADHTDFGTVTQGNSTVSRTYTVTNTGTGVLITSGLTTPAGYTITDGLADSIPAGGSDTFTIRLNSATLGEKSGQISFVTNDSDENPYNFSIVGVVEPPPPFDILAFDSKGKAEFIDADGDLIKVQVKNGSGEIHIPVGGGDALAIVLTNTDSKTSLSIKGATTVGDISADGPVKDIKAKEVFLNGDMTIAGSLGKVDLAGTTAASIWSIGGNASDKGVSIKIGEARDVSINSTAPINALVANDWLNTDAIADRIEAPSIGKATIKGNLEASLASTSQVDIKSVKVTGWLDQAEIRAAGGIGSVKLGGMRGSSILAGMSAALTGLPTTVDDFVLTSSGIKSVKIAGSVSEGDDSYLDSVIAAWNLGKVSLNEVRTDNNGIDFGVAGSELKGVDYTSNGNKWKSPKSTTVGDIQVEQDFIVRRV